MTWHCTMRAKITRTKIWTYLKMILDAYTALQTSCTLSTHQESVTETLDVSLILICTTRFDIHTMLSPYNVRMSVCIFLYDPPNRQRYLSTQKWPFYPWKHSLTLISTVLLQNLTSSQLVDKVLAFYGTRRFITAFISARYLSPILSQINPIHVPNLLPEDKAIFYKA